MRKPLIYSIVSVLIGIGCLVFFLFLTGEEYGEVKGTIADALSGDAVREVRILVDGKSTIKFASTSYSLTEIPPGSYTLKASAPNYYDFTKPIQVKRGKNLVDIAMRGREIPDLQGIIIFTEAKEKGIEIEIRFTDSKKEGIVNYPALPLTLEGVLFLRGGTEGNYEKRRKIFEGPIELFWDSEEWLAKNKGIIPWDRIKADSETEKYGILQVVLHTPQGDFEDRSEEVELFREAR
jgi:hypothetical protein